MVSCKDWPLLFVDQSGQRRHKHGGGATERRDKMSSDNKVDTKWEESLD